ncbi:receptor-type tyrosine-protein phosphatase eta-like [Sinocyclocheilus rhinocerous]|uniref:receptor-type tyrosine-protein phosphatase eta-like n=1 Tax=Sinocyclocheilus rhinocerous TaxID=307959 RepID=UPI0007B8F709|nr:PREDICTED: receptor-type tyrosine-protein phosphatase eta-like [Sinocyclocheilus rhinocerous]
MNTLWLPLLLSSVIWAEEQYFPQLPNATWDDARLYCQSCFKELMTITCSNVHLIVKNLSSDYWVGLRRSYNGSFPWAEWSNGDPVTYQNWYPGHPVPNKEKKLIPICSSTTESPLSTLITTTTSTLMTSLETSTVTSAPVTSPKTSTIFQTEKAEDTCPILTDILDCLNMTCYDLESAMTMCNRTTTVTPKTTTYNTVPVVTTFSTTFNAATNGTTTNSTTTEGATTEDPTTEGATTESTTTSNCISEPEPDPEQYIEDACVVLLSFGMWKEEDCNKSLPYICYKERFFGQIYVSDVNTSAANLSWTEGPGAENISHYRVEITEDNNQTFNQTFNHTFFQTELFEHIQNLTAGTLYRVQMFPVKCGRDLNPQNISFYTQPSDVQNLTIVGMTNVSANLKWRNPEGNCDFYSVHVECKSNKSIHDKVEKCPSEECTIKNLAPGYEYEFTVKAVVNETFGGVPSSASDYTKPSTVTNLKQAYKNSTFIIASWDPPEGGYSGYRYCLKKVDYSHKCTYCNIITSSSSTTDFSITDCNIVNATTNVINETDKPDGSKFCLCVAALTNNDIISGEMVPIPAYTLPKTVNLSLEPGSDNMTASWETNGKYEYFKVIITTDAYPDNPLPLRITELNYTFKNLKAGVYYTVSVYTVNGDLISVPAIESKYTKPTKPAWVNAIASKTSIDVYWGAPEMSQGATINYTVEYYTAFWNKSDKIYTNGTNTNFTGLNPGTRYDINFLVVADDLSEPATYHAYTVPKKRTLVLTMLCSSETALHCDKTDTRKKLFDKLKNITYNTFENKVHWNLSWAKTKDNVL